MSKAGAHVPLIPLVEVVGSGASGSPEQIAATAANVGVTSGLTVTVKVVVIAHWPAVGVKVYVPVAVLLTAGAHVPVMPSLEVVGRTGAGSPLHIAATAANVGVTNGLTVMVKVVETAHWPAVGVNEYVVVVVLFNAGAQPPLMPLVEVVGNGASGSPEQIAATAANVGVVLLLTVMVNVVVVAH